MKLELSYKSFNDLLYLRVKVILGKNADGWQMRSVITFGNETHIHMQLVI